MSAGIKEWSAARLAVAVKSMVHKRPVWPLMSKTKHARSCKPLETRIVSFLSSIQRAGGCTPLWRACLCLLLKASPFGGNKFRHEMFVNHIASMNTNCLELDVFTHFPVYVSFIVCISFN